jgi:hypothetical protein
VSDSLAVELAPALLCPVQAPNGEISGHAPQMVRLAQPYVYSVCAPHVPAG